MDIKLKKFHVLFQLAFLNVGIVRLQCRHFLFPNSVFALDHCEAYGPTVDIILVAFLFAVLVWSARSAMSDSL